MANSGAIGTIKYVDTFSNNSIGSVSIGIDGGTLLTAAVYGVNWLQSIDTGDTAFAVNQSATLGMHAAGSGTGVDNALIEFNGGRLMFYGQQGFTAVEGMFQFDVVTDLTFNFGLNDEITESGNTIPVELRTATWDSTSTTFLGFVFDTQATNDELHCFWVDDGVDTVVALGDLRCKGMSLTANKWLWLRVEMQDQGSGNPVRATFHAAHDGKSITKEFTTTVDRDSAFCWYFGAQAGSAVAHGIKIKAPGWEQTISD